MHLIKLIGISNVIIPDMLLLVGSDPQNSGGTQGSVLVDTYTEKPVLNISVRRTMNNFTVAADSPVLRIVK